MVPVEPSNSYSSGSGNSVPGSASPVSSAVAGTTGLKVDPGANNSLVARSLSGLSGSARRESHISWASSPSSDSGSNEGEETAASTAPVLGSRATTAPACPASASDGG